MTSRRKALSSIVRGLAAAAMLATAPVAAWAQDSGGHVRFALHHDIYTTDPHQIGGGSDYVFMSNVYEGLWGHDLEGNPAPELAESYTVSEDGLVYTFKLRENALFHNGEPVTAADVRYSWERSNLPEINNGRAGILTRNVSDVVIVDDKTVELVLSSPDASFMENLGEYFYIVPKEYTEANSENFAAAPVGSGPFKFVARNIKESIELEAFKDHWGRAPSIDGITILVVEETQTRLSMLQTGEVDVIAGVPPQLGQAVDAMPGINLLRNPTYNNIFFAINMHMPEFEDTRVRQAMNYAVNRQEMLQSLLYGYASLSAAPCHPQLIGCDIGAEPYPYDPEKARALLEEADFPFSNTYTIFGQSGGRTPQARETLEAVSGFLNQVGIQTRIEFLDGGAWLARVNGKEFDKYAGYSSTWTDYNRDPWARLMRGTRQGGVLSWAKYPDLDERIDAANSIIDPDEREAELRSILTRLYEDPHWIILWTVDDLYAVRDNIEWTPRQAVSWPVLWSMQKNADG